MWIESPAIQKNKRTTMGRRKSGTVRPNRRSTGNATTGTGQRPTEYAKPKRTPKSGTARRRVVPTIAPWKIVVGSLLIGVIGLLYITHLLATQQALEEVQTLQHEYNRTYRIYNETKLAYDRMTGPKEIYQRAREAGFINAGPTDPILNLSP